MRIADAEATTDSIMSQKGVPLTGSSWETDEFDIDAYLARMGVKRGPPTIETLNMLMHAHLHTYAFANVDILLGQHKDVAPRTVQERLVARSRGGYCFQHLQIFAAALESMGFCIERHLGRVYSWHDCRTHMTVFVSMDDGEYMCDPGFIFSPPCAMKLVDGATYTAAGRTFEIRKVIHKNHVYWELRRGGKLQHVTDLLPIEPQDVQLGDVVTSRIIRPFLDNLMLGTYIDEDTYVTVTANSRTIRRTGQPTKHVKISAEEAVAEVSKLKVELVQDEPERLAAALKKLDIQ
ncbi:hypothetical protein MVES1_001501 [Malassezia vespertilionis]|uniref:Uncharacterized protein n=1 Tax=Malassezia vespertilionis TaxID=2020962 RepID=A0A2N1JDM1_9BASI|nr:uncharacterized protein MVES1_001501 [Malassezia vespertilionis]PKI84643.1 hypothetical protein MVES_001415 [Malassezia vespertilionis]WFD06159.1 hypothetical protein MVES1_001501 [Malassezia vespertilionis]